MQLACDLREPAGVPSPEPPPHLPGVHSPRPPPHFPGSHSPSPPHPSGWAAVYSAFPTPHSGRPFSSRRREGPSGSHSGTESKGARLRRGGAGGAWDGHTHGCMQNRLTRSYCTAPERHAISRDNLQQKKNPKKNTYEHHTYIYTKTTILLYTWKHCKLTFLQFKKRKGRSGMEHLGNATLTKPDRDAYMAPPLLTAFLHLIWNNL